MSNSSGGGARRLGGEEARDLEVLERREADEEEEGRPEDRAVVDPRKRRRMAMEILIVYCARCLWRLLVEYGRVCREEQADLRRHGCLLE